MSHFKTRRVVVNDLPSTPQDLTASEQDAPVGGGLLLKSVQGIHLPGVGGRPELPGRPDLPDLRAGCDEADPCCSTKDSGAGCGTTGDG